MKTLTKLVLPFADMFIIRMTQAQNAKRGVISYTKQNFDQINNECYVLYRRVCECLPWNLYQTIMRKNIVKITGLNLKKGQKKSSTNEKNMTKVICAIIAGFHFDVPDVVDVLENTLKEKQKVGELQDILDKVFGSQEKPKKVNTVEDEGLASDSEAEVEEAEEEIQVQIEAYLEQQEVAEVTINREAIIRTIIKNFLPALFKHLKETDKRSDSPDDAKIRLHVAVAIVRLLRKTTNKHFNDGFHKLIRNIVQSLRSKQVKIRDKAREALVQVNLNVSPYLIHYTIDEMQKSLRKGYQRHVRSFTLHHIIDALVKEGHLKIGQLDHCLGSKTTMGRNSSLEAAKINKSITSILLDELFGKLGVEKDIEGTGLIKIKETKSKRALQTYDLLAQHINFETTFLKLIIPILNKSEVAIKQSDQKKCEEVMAIISSSILKNPSVRAEPLLLVLYAIMQKGTQTEDKLKEVDQFIESEEFKKKSRLKQEIETFKVLPAFRQDLSNLRKPNSEISKNLLVSFSLSTLKKAIGILPIEEYKEKLDSFCKVSNCYLCIHVITHYNTKYLDK